MEDKLSDTKNPRPGYTKDLSVPHVMHLEDVANLLGITPGGVRSQIERETIAVMPRKRKGTRDMLIWSSIDWHKWFYGRK